MILADLPMPARRHVRQSRRRSKSRLQVRRIGGRTRLQKRLGLPGDGDGKGNFAQNGNPRNLISVKHGNLPKCRFAPDARRQKTGPGQRAKLRQARAFPGRGGGPQAKKSVAVLGSWAQRRVCEAAQVALQRAKEKLSLSSTGSSLHPGNIAGSVQETARQMPEEAGKCGRRWENMEPGLDKGLQQRLLQPFSCHAPKGSSACLRGEDVVAAVGVVVANAAYIFIGSDQ